ncbi:hypothetical protein CANCADRAFT_32683 [Tortispora caseinolytica NRRL Y-17796]|uniref:Uncharacterized protein n=1 Tax=Tortispora caseinolytica NRRL Y-17796 TaxID=767744 RepID=A0A1E4TCD2_9ASCO|nr:hypothetical protein CANCADRAFT_32683 [Tortispora caseinolytica NRRL Y-17796]
MTDFKISLRITETEIAVVIYDKIAAFMIYNSLPRNGRFYIANADIQLSAVCRMASSSPLFLYARLGNTV